MSRNISDNQINEIDIVELVLTLWSQKKFISTITIFIAMLSILISYSLTEHYTSHTTLMTKAGSSQSMSGSYSAIANFAGIAMPESSSADNKFKLAMRKVTTMDFFEKNLYSDNYFLSTLMVFESYDKDSRTEQVDSSQYDTKKESWISNKPTLEESHEYFLENFDVKEDKEGYVDLSFTHQSPIFAKDMLNKIIFRLDNEIMALDKKKASKSIGFLKGTLANSQIPEVRKSISTLIEENLKSLSLIDTSDEYTFSIVESARVPERRSSPKRTLIVFSASFVSITLSSLFIITLFFFDKMIKFSISLFQIKIKLQNRNQEV